MVSPRRALALAALTLGLGVFIASYALTNSGISNSALSATATVPSDPTSMRTAATAVARQVQATLTTQRVDLATRVAVQSPGPASPAPAAAASPSSDGPAASPEALGSPVETPPDPLLPGTFRFYRGINLGGAAENVEGRPWLGDAQARAQGLLTPSAAPVFDTDDPLSPPTDPSTARMLQSTIYVAGAGQLRMTLPVPNGTYAVYVYLIENYQSAYRSLDVAVEANVGRTGWSAPRGGWEKLGPYVVAVADGALDVDVTATTGDPLVAGLAIFHDEGTPAPSPVALSPRDLSPVAVRRPTACSSAASDGDAGCPR